jgi:hypothetical protein
MIPQQGIPERSCATTAVIVSGKCSGCVVEVIDVLSCFDEADGAQTASERPSAKSASTQSDCPVSALSLFHRKHNKAH